MFRYAITIFLSAFLLFQVQPLIGKFILPWFGGGPAVWTSCMLFFQVLLLGGYSYAHFISSRLSPRALAAVHTLLLLASLAFLPIAPKEWLKPSGDEMPIGQIMILLGVTIGLPYFLLSSTGPLLQETFRRETGRTPYRLYSLSNIGSLLALLTYPFVFEPQLKLYTQINAWSIGYAAFVLFCGWCTINFARANLVAEPAGQELASAPAERPRAGQIVIWLALAACGSLMLLATTNQLCQEVTSVPFLWIVPLSLYLLTFIICFDREAWYQRGVFIVLLVVAVGLACYATYKGTALPMWQQVAIYSVTLWVCCMVCHGELVRARPAPQYATLFYLMVSAGGAIGGLLVAVVAPLALPDFWEYQIGLVLTVLLAFFATQRRPQTAGGPAVPIYNSAWIIGGTLAVIVGLALGVFLFRKFDVYSAVGEVNLETTRNFYGVLRVNIEEDNDDNGPLRELVNGRIQHGMQYLDEDKQHWPTTYYGHPSGVGLAIDHHPRRQEIAPADRTLRIGVVGLGAGTLAAYGEKGDYIRFYEINPAVIRLSEEYFSYRTDTPAKVDVVLGDARIKMEQELAAENSQQFDVLAIDAFSSDAIPMHLLTKEAVDLYLQELKPDGMLCIHVSNRFLDLASVVIGIAQELNYPCVMVAIGGDSAEGLNASSWAILTRNWEFLADPDVLDASEPCWPEKGGPIVWTDDYGSLWQVLSD